MPAKNPILAAVALASLAALFPGDADACTVGCGPGEVTPHQGAVPANLPALLWHPATRVADEEINPAPQADDVELVHLEEGKETRVPVSLQKVDYGLYPAWEIVPEESLAPGASYELRAGKYCEFEEELTEGFQTGPESPLPQTLGKLRAGDITVGELMLSSSECSSAVTAAKVPVRVDLSAEAEPWKHALLFETLVDGEPWTPRHGVSDEYPPGESWKGRGEDMVYGVCQGRWSRHQLGEGKHTVQMKATLAGINVELVSNEITVDIDCDPGIGCSSTGRNTPSGAPLLAAALLMGVGLWGRRRNR